jgi:GntR family transcriptional regulator
MASPLTGAWSPDRSSGVPAYLQIEERLAGLIEAGRLVVGDRLPAERELATSAGVSRMTARAALRALADRGLVARDVGRGTFVARARVDHDLTALIGFTEVVRRQGLAPRSRIRAVEEMPAPDAVARELGLAPSAPVYRIERLRFADEDGSAGFVQADEAPAESAEDGSAGFVQADEAPAESAEEPLVLEDSWLPAACFPGLLDEDLRGSLYALLGDRFGRAPARAEERLFPVVADGRLAAALKVAVGAPLMLVERVAAAADGTPVEFARDHHRGDRSRFVVQVRSPGAA